ncbi:MAG: cellulase family glycosylhydrolase [Candidatus Marinimicrobia bacterium]|nr:cellulase family glycosylhydrolase [Candidatus Neomarinimicrobiota bacterium]
MRTILYAIILVQGMLRSQDFLRLDDGKIKNSLNETITLKGCNLGNWLQLEMWMFSYADKGYADQYEFIKTLEDRFGRQDAEYLMDIYRSNWIKNSDFDIIKSFGMNTVRLPFDYKLLMGSDSEPFSLKKDAWEWLDHTIKMAKERNLYVILDMHGAPGRQSGMDHSGRVGYNKLWSNKGYQKQTAWLWNQISKRYKDEPTVAAYDLLNEPWGSDEKNLKKVVLECYRGIRENNDNHIVIFPGHTSGIDFYENIRSVNLDNVIYTMHFYPGFFGWGSPEPYIHAQFIKEGLPIWKEKMESFNSPLLIGEFNVVLKKAGGGEMMRRYYDYCESLNWPATMWSYKVLNENGGIGEGSWGMVTNENKLADIDLTYATKNEIAQWFESFGTMKYSIDEDLRYWLTTSDQTAPLASLPAKPPALLKPPGEEPLPSPWAVKDIGRSLNGGQIIQSNDWTFYGGGNDIWNTDDQFRFAYQKIGGDFSFTVKVDSLKNTHPYAKAGIMVRKNLNKNSAHGIINVFPSGATEYGYREKNGQAMKAVSGPSLDWSNARLKIKKLDTQVQFFIFKGKTWELIGELDIAKWGKSFYVGIATLSHDNSQLTTATYSNIKLDEQQE